MSTVHSPLSSQLITLCKLSTVIINGTLMRTDTSAAPHTSSSSQSSTASQKIPFYMARLQHCTDSHSTDCCDMICLPVSHRAASCTVTWGKRWGILNMQPFLRTVVSHGVETEEGGFSTWRGQWMHRCTNKQPKHHTWFRRLGSLPTNDRQSSHGQA